LIINPYQPTSEVSETPIADVTDPSTVLWGAWSIYWRVVLAVFSSGSLFGALCVFIPIVLSIATEESGERFLGVLMMVPIGGIVGGIFAAIAAVPTLGVLLPVFILGNPGGDWSRSRILWFAGVGGFFSGVLSISVPASFDPSAIAFSLLPGAFGAVGSLLAMRYMSRKMPGVTSQDVISSKPARTSESTPLSTPVDAI
jgi:hypothetical protein